MSLAHTGGQISFRVMLFIKKKKKILKSTALKVLFSKFLLNITDFEVQFCEFICCHNPA